MNARLLLAGWLIALPLGAQQAALGPGSKGSATGQPSVDRHIPGVVKDLSRDSLGRILYCTAEGEVGRIVPGGPRTVLATQPGNFPFTLRAVAETPGGDVAVVDIFGHVRLLQGGNAPATLVYNDQWMIEDATDLVVDARGNYLIASSTPSNGLRAINWVSSDGQRWGYYLVRHGPVQLASDPLTGGLVLSGQDAGGELRLVTAGSEIRETTPIDTLTHPGPSAALDDGDVAAEADGDLFWVAGGNVYRHARSKGTTALYAGGFGPLRGVVIAKASGLLSSPASWSLYVAEGGAPTVIHELPNVGAPGDLIASDQGQVPDRGLLLPNVVPLGMQVFDLAVDNQGRLLLGGSLWSTTHAVKRITLTPTPSLSTVATINNGLAGIIEGLCVAPDDSIYALSRQGTIQRITEGPLSITTVFSDPLNQITAGKDLALDLDGSLYVGTREFWDFGKLLRVSAGTATLLTTTEETRGLAADPAGGLLLSQWHDAGFHGSVDRYSFDTPGLSALPGFATMNYTNDSGWGDGDVVVDANGSIYTVSEDDWSLVRYDPGQQAFVRIGSGYKNHPSGLAIAASTGASGSTTGWSLYVSEFDFIWEKPSVPAPAPTLVDSTVGFTANRGVAGALNPRYGQPRTLGPAPAGGGLLVATSAGWLLGLDPSSGAVEPIAGPEDGLRGDLVALSSRPGEHRVRLASREGELFEVRGRTVRRIDADRPSVSALAEQEARAPRKRVSQPDPRSGATRDFVLDGWVVWQVAAD